MTQMEDNALNKDHSKTTSMPTDMAELGSDNSDQELTLSLLGSEKDALDQIEAALEADRRRQLWPVRDVRREDPQVPPGSHPLCGTVRPMCLATGRRPRALSRMKKPGLGSRLGELSKWRVGQTVVSSASATASLPAGP